MEENKTWQKLAAEFLGTAFLVFVGVGSVPATLIVNGDAPFTMASLGFISLAFGTIVIATVYVFGYISGNHINPAVTLGLAVTGKFPWRQVPGYLIAQVLGAVVVEDSAGEDAMAGGHGGGGNGADHGTRSTRRSGPSWRTDTIRPRHTPCMVGLPGPRNMGRPSSPPINAGAR